MQTILEELNSSQISESCFCKILKIMEEWYSGEFERGLTECLPESYQALLVWNHSKTTLLGFHLYSIESLLIGSEEVRVINSFDFAGKLSNKAASSVMMLSVLKKFLSIAKENKEFKHYWFLPIGSYFVYHYSNRIFKVFYPNPSLEFPPFEKQVLDTISLKTYGTSYNPENLIIKNNNDKNYYLKNGEDFSDNHDTLKNFFHNLNPNSNSGDEMATIIPFNGNNLTDFCLRIL